MVCKPWALPESDTILNCRSEVITSVSLWLLDVINNVSLLSIICKCVHSFRFALCESEYSVGLCFERVPGLYRVNCIGDTWGTALIRVFC